MFNQWCTQLKQLSCVNVCLSPLTRVIQNYMATSCSLHKYQVKSCYFEVCPPSLCFSCIMSVNSVNRENIYSWNVGAEMTTLCLFNCTNITFFNIWKCKPLFPIHSHVGEGAHLLWSLLNRRESPQTFHKSISHKYGRDEPFLLSLWRITVYNIITLNVYQKFIPFQIL